jgi:hypothetical protein
LTAMRFVVAILCAVLIVGCQSPQDSHGDVAAIAASLQRRVTEEEARHIVLGYVEDRTQKLQERAASDEDSRVELEVLDKKRQRSISRLEAFLSGSRKGDELWTYRTATRPCQESGLALVSAGRVVEHMPLITAYVGR